MNDGGARHALFGTTSHNVVLVCGVIGGGVVAGCLAAASAASRCRRVRGREVAELKALIHHQVQHTIRMDVHEICSPAAFGARFAVLVLSVVYGERFIPLPSQSDGQNSGLNLSSRYLRPSSRLVLYFVIDVLECRTRNESRFLGHTALFSHELFTVTFAVSSSIPSMLQ